MMKKMLSLSLLGLACSVLAQDTGNTGPLTFETPPGWTVSYQESGGARMYTFSHSEPLPMKVLMLSAWPTDGSRESIPALMGTLAQGFLEGAKQSQVPLKTETYVTKDIAGSAYSGQYVGFVIDLPGDTPQVQTLFMIGDDQGLWNGQYTGPADEWKLILKMLSTIKNSKS